MYRIHYINEEIEPKERKIYLEKNIRLRGQIELEEDLHKTLTLISSKWKMQNNRKDQQTGFIYRTQSLEECLRQIEKQVLIRIMHFTAGTILKHRYSVNIFFVSMVQFMKQMYITMMWTFILTMFPLM